MFRAHVLKALLPAFLVLGLLPVSASAAADPNGTWKWKFNSPNGDIDLAIMLKAEGEKLTGKFSFMDQSSDISDGTFKDDEVNFKVVQDFGGQTIASKYKGKVEGDTIKGTIDIDFGGQAQTFEWVCTREKK
jgi:hypothetical protein